MKFELNAGNLESFTSVEEVSSGDIVDLKLKIRCDEPTIPEKVTLKWQIPVTSLHPGVRG